MKQRIMKTHLLSIDIRFEQDVVAARQRSREVASLLGFDVQDQSRIATAVSEIARNAFCYARDGAVQFNVQIERANSALVIDVSDRGPGISSLANIMNGKYESKTGMGLGIVGARRLMDKFHVESSPSGGTNVSMAKFLPKTCLPITAARLDQVARELKQHPPQSPLDEIRQQNQVLLSVLDELRKRQEELACLNTELEDTNRGVVALYAELDEKADHLRRADEMKSRFLSNMSHEFRTPVNSIMALARILLDHADGDLTPEQEKQVGFIRKAASDLSELVNDLLDLAKVEAGKIVVHPQEFTVGDLFGTLRGMLKPLLVTQSLALVFEDASALPTLYTDEGKVSQILRNFVSNALKFTEKGEVRVTAELSAAGDAI